MKNLKLKNKIKLGKNEIVENLNILEEYVLNHFDDLRVGAERAESSEACAKDYDFLFSRVENHFISFKRERIWNDENQNAYEQEDFYEIINIVIRKKECGVVYVEDMEILFDSEDYRESELKEEYLAIITKGINQLLKIAETTVKSSFKIVITGKKEVDKVDNTLAINENTNKNYFLEPVVKQVQLKSISKLHIHIEDNFYSDKVSSNKFDETAKNKLADGTEEVYVPAAELHKKIKELVKNSDKYLQSEDYRLIACRVFGLNDCIFEKRGHTRVLFRDLKPKNISTEIIDNVEYISEDSTFEAEFIFRVMNGDDITEFEEVLNDGFELLKQDQIGGGIVEIKFL